VKFLLFMFSSTEAVATSRREHGFGFHVPNFLGVEVSFKGSYLFGGLQALLFQVRGFR